VTDVLRYRTRCTLQATNSKIVRINYGLAMGGNLQSVELWWWRYSRMSTTRDVAPIMISCTHGLIAKHRLASGYLPCQMQVKAQVGATTVVGQVRVMQGRGKVARPG